MVSLSKKHLDAISKRFPLKDRQAFVDGAIEKALGELPTPAAHAAPGLAGGDFIEIYVDGGSRGNPGPSGGGFAIFARGKCVAQGSEFFGERTNNQAEYLALRAALREAYSQFPDSPVRCFMDSQLVVEQMNGRYRVKSPNVIALHEEVRRIADQLKHFEISHIPREENGLADKLANRAMDRRG